MRHAGLCEHVTKRRTLPCQAARIAAPKPAMTIKPARVVPHGHPPQVHLLLALSTHRARSPTGFDVNHQLTERVVRLADDVPLGPYERNADRKDVIVRECVHVPDCDVQQITG